MNPVVFGLALLLMLIVGGMLAASLTRVLTSRRETARRMADDAAKVSDELLTHDLMTTGEGTRLLLRGGKLSVPDGDDVSVKAR